MDLIPGVQNRRDPKKDLLFVFAYIRNGFHAAPAAREAGFSEATACNNAGRWITAARADSIKPDLWDIVHDWMAKQIQAEDVTEQRIIQEYARIAFFDPIQMFDQETGDFLHPKDMPEDVRRVIGGFDVVTDGFLQRLVKMKLVDKKHALDALARIKGMFKETVEVQHSFSDFLKSISTEAAQEQLVKGDGTVNVEFEELVPIGKGTS